MSDSVLPDSSVAGAFASADKHCGGRNKLVGRIDASDSLIRHWIRNNRVPSGRAKAIEAELGADVVSRAQLNSDFA